MFPFLKRRRRGGKSFDVSHAEHTRQGEHLRGIFNRKRTEKQRKELRNSGRFDSRTERYMRIWSCWAENGDRGFVTTPSAPFEVGRPLCRGAATPAAEGGA